MSPAKGLVGSGQRLEEGSNKSPSQKLANVGPGSAGPAKIDADLVNVANENRVILNVGGIRHETYKVSVNNCSLAARHRRAPRSFAARRPQAIGCICAPP